MTFNTYIAFFAVIGVTFRVPFGQLSQCTHSKRFFFIVSCCKMGIIFCLVVDNARGPAMCHVQKKC